MAIGFRDLHADEIEARVSQIVEGKGLFLLLYKNARCDMNILDEVVGPENWQREHYEVKGNLFCRVGIKTDSGEWVWKSDCGTESNTEAKKGEASDSFKRACFNWGIGRELYTAPKIWIPSDKCNIKKNSKNRPVCYDNFEVSEIEIKDKRIVGLTIMNDGKVCFEWPRNRPKPATKTQLDAIKEISAKLDGVREKTADEWQRAAMETPSVRDLGNADFLTQRQASAMIEVLNIWLEKMHG